MHASTPRHTHIHMRMHTRMHRQTDIHMHTHTKGSFEILMKQQQQVFNGHTCFPAAPSVSRVPSWSCLSRPLTWTPDCSPAVCEQMTTEQLKCKIHGGCMCVCVCLCVCVCVCDRERERESPHAHTHTQSACISMHVCALCAGVCKHICDTEW